MRFPAAVAIAVLLAPVGVLLDPPPGKLYHGVYPGSRSGMGGDITSQGVAEYRRQAGKRPTWVYFCNNWYESRQFPRATAAWIRAAGSIPYIRLILVSNAEIPRPDPVFTLANILAGRFDEDFRRWMRAARAFATPLLAEYGTEVNGWWFPWNGLYNREGGSEQDAVDRFRRAYRHIISIARQEGAFNIRWVFHIDPWDEPAAPWNRFENYYPGDEWIDWLGASVYGRQIPHDKEAVSFRRQMDWVYSRFVRLAAKPVVVCEFGTIKDRVQAAWAEQALRDLTGGRWPRVIGFCWWSGRFRNDPDRAAVSDMTLAASPSLAALFRKYVGANRNVLRSPLTAPYRF